MYWSLLCTCCALQGKVTMMSHSSKSVTVRFIKPIVSFHSSVGLLIDRCRFSLMYAMGAQVHTFVVDG